MLYRFKIDLLLQYLQDLGLDDKDIRIISNLSSNQTAEVRLPYSSITEEFKIRESILPSMLFNLYVEKVFVFEHLIKVNGVPINNMLTISKLC